MKINLKGVHSVRRKLVSGKFRYHYYTCRGGKKFWVCDTPAIESRAFLASFQKAVEFDRGGVHGTLGVVITEYLKSITGLAKETQATYRLYTGHVTEKFRDTPLRYFDEPRIRRVIIKWRDEYAKTPRAADQRVAALCRVLSYAVDSGDISANRALNISNLYKHKKDEPIWSQQQINAYVAEASDFLRWHFLLKLYTGFRRKDIIALPIAADKGTHFEYRTAKRGKVVIVPIIRECRHVLAEIDAYRKNNGITAFTILFNSRGRSWTTGGINSQSRKIKVKLDIKIREHRLRGNFATELIKAGFKDREVGDILGWSTDRIREMRRIYVDQNDIIMAQIKRLNDHKL